VVEPDLLVLSPAIVPGDYSKLAGMLDVELTQDGFFREAEGKFKPVETLRDGVFVCGLAHSPRDMSETIAQAQAAAQRALSMLSRRQLRSGGIVAEVNARRCSVCEVCIGVCHYNARVRDEDEGVVVVREALCRGCGACATACPNGAAQLRGFSERQVFAMMDTV
jgi:heterodisulfide reductase subunit A